MIDAVIFDLDDTFSLTEAVCFDLENVVLQQMGRPPMSRQVHLATWEMRPKDALPLRSPGIDVAAFTAIYEPLLAECIATGKLDIIPDPNYAALDQLAALGKTILVLTSRREDRIIHLLQPDHALAYRIKGFYYAGKTKFRKPDPRVFDELLRDFALQPDRCVYVGDSIYDARAAKQAGLHFIASLESGLRQKQDFDGLSVDVFIDTFPDVVSAVQGFASPTIASH